VLGGEFKAGDIVITGENIAGATATARRAVSG
jgi:hypothetical protein